MQRLSDTSIIKYAAASGRAGSDLMQQLGSTGSGGLTSASPEVSRAWLVGQRPEEVDDKIRRSLTSQLGVNVSVNREWRFPEGKPAYRVSTSAGLTGLSTDTQPKAIAKLEAAMTPLTVEQAEKLVVQVQAVLARRNASEETAEVAFDVYVHVLRQHPADVATEVVRVLTTEPRENGKGAWMPSPPEIEGMCRALSSERHAMFRAVRDWKPVDEAVLSVRRLEGEFRRLQAEATTLGMKVGPGPSVDDGPRGERIAAWNAAVEKATVARRVWLEAEKALDARE